MTTDYLNFLEQNSPEKESASSDVPASNNFVNLTLRADAECQVTCDGDFLVLLNPNQITKEKAPAGQHILQFISTTHPDIQVEKIVDFPEAGKNYLVLVNEFSGLMKDIEQKELEQEMIRRQEHARREAELALAEAERIKAEAEIAKARDEAAKARKRAEELERKKVEERAQNEQRIQNLNSTDFIEKYLMFAHCSYHQVWTSGDGGVHHWEPFIGSQYSSITKAKLYDYEDSHYVVKSEYTSIDIQIAVNQDILPAIKIGNAKAMFVYSIILVGQEHCATTYIKNKEALNMLMQSIKSGCVEATAYWGKLLWASNKQDEKWIMQQLNEQGDFGTLAKSFLEKSACQGHVESLSWLSMCYLEIPSSENLLGVTGHLIMGMSPQSRIEEGFKLCQRASDLGSFNSMVRLANWFAGTEEEIWRNGFAISRPSMCPYDDEKALRLYLSAVAMCETRSELGRILENVPDRLKFDILKCAFNKGICNALEEGHSYYNKACQCSDQSKTGLFELTAKLYLFSADEGNADAQNCIANCYYNGNGVSQSYEEAVKWYKLSVNQGNIWAQSNLANCYYDGLGVRQDYEEALRLYILSAEQNNSWAQYRLGICYYDGLGCHVDYDEAKKWLVLAFKNGEQRAKEYLEKLPASMRDVDIITMLEDSKLTSEQEQSDVEQSSDDDFEDKFGDYLELLEDGDKSVLIKIANCFYKGDGVPKIPEDASLYFMRAIEESEDVDDWREAVSGLKSLAEQGCTEAQLALGDLYSDGWPSTWKLEENNILHGDEKLSLQWYKKAANAGSSFAMIRLGDYYNTENDIDEAESWYKRAIQASGEKEGINELIKLYDNEGWEDEALELCERYGRDIEEIREDWSLI